MMGAILFVASSSSALAQCAMCRAAVGNSTEAAKASSGMNLAVLVLLVPPVALFCAFFIVAYRYRKAPDEMAAMGQEKSQKRSEALRNLITPSFLRS
jgi:heme/copper-type cytochrome/quinol oxidase subunit 2